MALIPIHVKTKGHFVFVNVIVDDSDLVTIGNRTLTGYIDDMTSNVYVRIYVGKGKTEYLHRFLMKPDSTMVVDHINRNTLDNRRENLRVVTRKENLQNKNISSRTKSGVRGVYWAKVPQKWGVCINVDGKSKSFGYFDKFEDAVKRVTDIRKEMYPHLFT